MFASYSCWSATGVLSKLLFRCSAVMFTLSVLGLALWQGAPRQMLTDFAVHSTATWCKIVFCASSEIAGLYHSKKVITYSQKMERCQLYHWRLDLPERMNWLLPTHPCLIKQGPDLHLEMSLQDYNHTIKECPNAPYNQTIGTPTFWMSSVGMLQLSP